MIFQWLSGVQSVLKLFQVVCFNDISMAPDTVSVNGLNSA